MLSGFQSQSRRRAHSAEALDSLRLKNSRSGCQSRVTALYRAIGFLQEEVKHVREVSENLLEIDEVLSRFEKAHYGYIATLPVQKSVLLGPAWAGLGWPGLPHRAGPDRPKISIFQKC